MVITQKRPLLLSITCVMGFLGIVISFPNIFSPFIKQLGIWYPALFGSIISARFVALVGVWYLKKWGVILFAGVFIVNEIMRTFVNDVSYIEIIFSAFISIVFLCYYKIMDRNL